MLSYHVRLRLFSDEQAFYGRGVSELLQLVEKRGSLRAAAIEMRMAYSKATRIIHRAEEVLGDKLLESSIGGAKGGGSILTEKAKDLVQRFCALEKELEAFCEELVPRYLGPEGF